METGTEREGRRGRNGTRDSERGCMCKRGGQQGTEIKRIPLVGDVLEYWEFYKGGGAD